MSIPFANIPQNWRVPLFYVELDGSQANRSTGGNRALLIGQKLAAGSATVATPYFCPDEATAATLFGVGSDLYRMVVAFRANNRTQEIWAVCMADASGSQATGPIVVSGPATAFGTIYLYIGGQMVQVPVASGDAASVIAAAINAAINAKTSLPVTSTVDTVTVTVTARHKGTNGNAIDIRHSYLVGQALPSGVALAVTQPTGGATDPSVAAAIAAVAGQRWSYVVSALADATNLALLKTEFADIAGRWSPLAKQYGQVFAAKQDTVSTLATFCATRNDQHLTVLCTELSPTYDPEIAAAYAAVVAKSADNDPARPFHTLALAGVLAPAIADQWSPTENNTLLYSGGTPIVSDPDGTVRICEAITTFVTAGGAASDSYLSLETMTTLDYLLRAMEGRVTALWSRCKVVNDGTRFGAGQAITTPGLIAGSLVAWATEQVRAGLIEDIDAFKAGLVVQRNAQNPKRVDILMIPALVQPLSMVAVLVQFRLGSV